MEFEFMRSYDIYASPYYFFYLINMFMSRAFV